MTLWCLERSLFQTVVKSAGQEKDQERFEVLSGVKDLNQLPENKLRKICDCLEEEYFETGMCIIRQEMVEKILKIFENYLFLRIRFLRIRFWEMYTRGRP